jgi:hypothetical protein
MEIGGRAHERRHVLVVSDVQLRPSIDKKLHDLIRAPKGSPVQARTAIRVHTVDVVSPLERQLDGLQRRGRSQAVLSMVAVFGQELDV